MWTCSPIGSYSSHITESAWGCLSSILLAWQRNLSTYFSNGCTYLKPRCFTFTLSCSALTSTCKVVKLRSVLHCLISLLSPPLHFLANLLTCQTPPTASSQHVLPLRHMMSAKGVFSKCSSFCVKGDNIMPRTWFHTCPRLASATVSGGPFHPESMARPMAAGHRWLGHCWDSMSRSPDDY